MIFFFFGVEIKTREKWVYIKVSQSEAAKDYEKNPIKASVDKKM